MLELDFAVTGNVKGCDRLSLGILYSPFRIINNVLEYLSLYNRFIRGGGSPEISTIMARRMEDESDLTTLYIPHTYVEWNGTLHSNRV